MHRHHFSIFKEESVQHVYSATSIMSHHFIHDGTVFRRREAAACDRVVWFGSQRRVLCPRVSVVAAEVPLPFSTEPD